MAAELATLAGWRNIAKVALGVCLLALGWGLKSRVERARLSRRHVVVAAQNAALVVAKERYRQAVAHLELRYQKLYGGLRDPASSHGARTASSASAPRSARARRRSSDDSRGWRVSERGTGSRPGGGEGTRLVPASFRA